MLLHAFIRFDRTFRWTIPPLIVQVYLNFSFHGLGEQLSLIGTASGNNNLPTPHHRPNGYRHRGSSTFIRGGTITYTITVTNSGGSTGSTTFMDVLMNSTFVALGTVMLSPGVPAPINTSTPTTFFAGKMVVFYFHSQRRPKLPERRLWIRE